MTGWAGAAVLITLIVMVAIVFVEWINSRKEIRRAEYSVDPEQLLAERFARGEIEEAEYARRLSTLRMGPAAELLFRD